MTPVQPRHIHLIAACGMGMGSLAGMLKASGYQVTGSDQHIYPPMSTQLQDWGVPLYNGFRPEHLIPRPDLVIVGNAVSRDNPEAVATRQAGIPVMSFPQALAHFFIGTRHAIVVAGTHGKSTTTALIAWVLQAAGYEPGFFVGAVMRNIDGTFGLGQGAHFVVEGDEYDSAYFDKGPKFMHYRPRTGVLTSLEFDHADIYRDLAHVREAFARFVQLLPQEGCLVACADAPQVRDLLAQVPVAAAIQTYGLAPDAAWRAVATAVEAGGTRLTVQYQGQDFGVFQAPLFGPHNVQNVLAAVAVAHRVGLTPAQIASGLASYAHIKRRCEVRGVVRDITVLDDFAHHPTAVRVTLAGVRQAYPGARLWAVFEPRTATSRRAVFQQEYAEAFALADRVLIADVFRRDQLPPAERFSPERLVASLQAQGVPAWFLPDTAAIIAQLCRETQPTDVVVIMSNGGFDNIHLRLLAALEQVPASPTAG
ncbi:MAG: UDP-N-acetylmuramate:L-alanyl-gamma-D-glutamyl-meso-diaminopimelate ligase [Candidatus Tectimicrobiota bacterium]